jgi:hypothetical protein
MSKHINVNPDHYKVAGRERPGSAAVSAPKQPRATGDERLREKWQKKQREKTTRTK